MLIFKELRWSNAFSYGSDNVLDFTSHQISQIIGKNGNGKSSIALILEEVLYNKNSKGIKKAKIINRNSNKSYYEIWLTFNKDGDNYEIYTKRGSTQTVSLVKNGSDISSHTSTGTYKLIEEIIGYDHKTFSQIVYQCSPFSLEFLTATDTNRKKFLVELFSLNRYTDIAARLKTDIAEAAKDVEVSTSAVNMASAWISKNSSRITATKEHVEVPVVPSSLYAELAALKDRLANIVAINKKISDNNIYREYAQKEPPQIPPAPTSDILQLKLEYTTAETALKDLKSKISANAKFPDKCTSCGQPIDNSHKKKIVEDATGKIPDAANLVDITKATLTAAEKEYAAYSAKKAEYATWESYVSKFNDSLPEEPERPELLKVDIANVEEKIRQAEHLQKQAIHTNRLVDAHNTEVKVYLEQLAIYEKELETHKGMLELHKTKLNTLQLLGKTFSPSGLIAYKLESMVKDLESITNTYLAEMSGGQFQLDFRISASDKLDVVIINNGDEVDIESLSRGELARVNVSTLLAIRRMMQSLTNTKTNLLILDETIDSIDPEGKEKLIEVLLSEEYLNTFLISHGFSHPLLYKMEVVKENEISRIEQ